MRHSRLWVAAAIIAFFVLVGFVLSVPHTRDVGKFQVNESVATSAPSVTLHDSFRKGLHTITGSVETPNACATVTAQASLSGEASSTNGILVELAISDDTGVCLQVPTRVNFTTTINASADLPITATVNGGAATTTVS